MCVRSLTLYHACKDSDVATSGQRNDHLVATYTPKTGDECLDGFVVAFVTKWIRTCSERCPRTPRHGRMTWDVLLEVFAKPLATSLTLRWRRGILDSLWRASQSSSVYWFAVMRAADFWDMPCLYWHMVYLTHERAKEHAFHHSRPQLQGLKKEPWMASTCW